MFEIEWYRKILNATLVADFQSLNYSVSVLIVWSMKITSAHLIDAY